MIDKRLLKHYSALNLTFDARLIDDDNVLVTSTMLFCSLL